MAPRAPDDAGGRPGRSQHDRDQDHSQERPSHEHSLNDGSLMRLKETLLTCIVNYNALKLREKQSVLDQLRTKRPYASLHRRQSAWPSIFHSLGNLMNRVTSIVAYINSHTISFFIHYSHRVLLSTPPPRTRPRSPRREPRALFFLGGQFRIVILRA